MLRSRLHSWVSRDWPGDLLIATRFSILNTGLPLNRLLRLIPHRYSHLSETPARIPKCRCAPVCLLLASLVMSAALGCNRAQNISRHLDFNQDVQPILANRCFSCHGPDPEMRKADLRLDLAEWAMKKRKGHRDAIIPGQPDKSELVKRIQSKDPHYLMPQTVQGEAKPMSADEIAILKEWIRQGAVYRPHWAFEAPSRPPVPHLNNNAAWAKNPIDNFILAKLEKEGLQPSPEADKATLIRRVALDLTGLLPTPEEVQAFISDNSPNAYERLVDALLANGRKRSAPHLWALLLVARCVTITNSTPRPSTISIP